MIDLSIARSYFPCSPSYPDLKDFKKLQTRNQIITVIAVAIITVLSIGILTFPTFKFCIEQLPNSPSKLKIAPLKLQSLTSPIDQKTCLREIEINLSLPQHSLDSYETSQLVRFIYKKADERSHIDGDLDTYDGGNNFDLYTLLLKYLGHHSENKTLIPRLLMRKILADFDRNNPNQLPKLFLELQYIINNTPKHSLIFKWASLRIELLQNFYSISTPSLTEEEAHKTALGVFNRDLKLSAATIKELRKSVYELINCPETKEKCFELIYLMSFNPLIVLQFVEIVRITATLSNDLDRLSVVSSYRVPNPSDPSSTLTIDDIFSI
jgi:hypothetical protein